MGDTLSSSRVALRLVVIFRSVVPQYREGAQSFLITQFGLSCFIWQGNEYQAHTFNFYLFPLPMLPGPSRRFMCDVSCLIHIHSGPVGSYCT